MHEIGLQEFLMWLEFIKELEYILCKDSKSHVDLMWWHLNGSFSYFSSIPSISRRIRGGNIRKENLAIKTKFFD
jgi:hypothetical protein